MRKMLSVVGVVLLGQLGFGCQNLQQCVSNRDCESFEVCQFGSCQADTTCRNGIKGPQELCDGDCPTSCPSSSVCETIQLVGSPSTCDAHCQTLPITACVSDDGCCPSDCTATQDHDCVGCGNGKPDDGELCDGNCPTSCPSPGVCETIQLIGSPSTCDAHCQTSTITACVSDDGCCPAGCTGWNDTDCSRCGNGKKEPGEVCDGDCPTTCPDSGTCQIGVLVGTTQDCDAHCELAPKTSCASNDGCCPVNCETQLDNDCVCAPFSGNYVITPTCSLLANPTEVYVTQVFEDRQCKVEMLLGGNPAKGNLFGNGKVELSVTGALHLCQGLFSDQGLFELACDSCNLTFGRKCQVSTNDCLGGDGCCPEGCNFVSNGDCLTWPTDLLMVVVGSNM